MLEFVRRNRVLISSGFFLMCSLALLSANARQPGRVDPLGRAFLEIMVPFQSVASRLTDRVGATYEAYVDLINVESENARLRTRLRSVEQRATRNRELELMNRRLKRLLALQRDLPTRALAAEVSARDATVWFQSLTLNRGESDGIAAGMPVLAPQGVVGVISSTSPHASRVLLLSDPNSGVDVLVQRTRVRGIVSGLLERGAVLKYVKRTEDVRVGDAVVASGLDGIFPKGMPIGRVTRVSRKDRGLFLYAEVTLAADAARLEEVLVAPASGAELRGRLALAEPELVGPPEPATFGIVGPYPAAPPDQALPKAAAR